MDVFFNERSFIGQARYYNALNLMRRFAYTVTALDPIRGTGEWVIHSSFGDRLLTNAMSVRQWLFDQHDPDLQAIRVYLIVSFNKGPFVEMLLEEEEHLCEWNGEPAEHSSLAGAAYCNGMLVSLGDCPAFPDGPLSIMYGSKNTPIEPRTVVHFTEPSSARRCRRRYVPNPKHHPTHATGDDTAMPLDTAYDPMDEAKQTRLRNSEESLPDTQAQRLLDSALPSGKQLYACTYNRRGHVEIYYEFQDDNTGGFHGYPVPASQVPADIIRRLRQQAG